MNMRFGTQNVRSLCRTGSLVTLLKELSKYKLHLVVAQEVTWEGVNTEPAVEYTFFYGKENENHELGTVPPPPIRGIISEVKRAKFVIDRMSYLIVLNVHAPTEDKTYDVKDSFYEEMECVLDTFPNYHDSFITRFQCQSRREDIFKLTIGDESLHENRVVRRILGPKRVK
jgi:hypothetical protein